MAVMKANPPWGTWEVLLAEATYKVKRITVQPGCRMSYQKHARRHEHWMVVRGQGVATLNGEVHRLSAGEAIDIPLGVAHRIGAEGSTPMVFIEIQTGDYFGEDDVIRLEDDYGRAGSVG